MTNYREFVPKAPKLSYDKMSDAELQVELAEIEPNRVRVHHDNGQYLSAHCGCLYCRIKARVEAEIKRREKRTKYRASFPAGTSFCRCGCGCDNETGRGETSYCTSCENGMCGE